jgi:hypothetical protein
MGSLFGLIENDSVHSARTEQIDIPTILHAAGVLVRRV